MRRDATAAAAAALLAFALLLVPWWGRPMDDAFISLRYAHNWAAGHGPVFNVGERVEGFSNPLWIALLALAHRLGAELVRAAQCLGVACAAAAVALAALRSRGPWSSAAALGVAASPVLLVWAGRGLAGPLFGALLIGANVLLEAGARDGRPRAGLFACAAALSLTRPEGVAWALLLLALAVPGADRARLARGLAGFALAVGAALAARVAYYGALVPNTYRAKMVAADDRLAHGLAYLADFVTSPSGAVALLALVATLVALARLRRAAPAALARLGVQVVAGLAIPVWMGGDWMPAHRFFAPVAALAPLLLAEALAALAARPPRVAVAAVLAAELALGIAPLAWGRLPADLDFYARQIDVYAAVGRWFAANTPPGASVACDAIGALGYYSDRRVIDLYGLIDPAIAALPARRGLPPGHQKYDVARSLARRPDYVLFNAAFLVGAPISRRAELLTLFPAGHLYGDLVRDPASLRDYRPASVPLRGRWLPLLVRRPPGMLAPASP